MLVIHEILGLDGHVKEVARRFAEQGYVAAAPNLFTGELQALLTPAGVAEAMKSLATAPPELRRDPSKFAEWAKGQPAERRPVLAAFGQVSQPSAHEQFARDALESVRFLRARRDVNPRRTGSLGFCFGGGISGRLATIDPELRAAVIFYGQNPPLDAVPSVRAAVLGLYGGEDPGITGTVPELAAAMAKAGRRFEHHVYPGAKHAFFNDTRPNYHAESARDAWDRVLQFYRETLAA